MPQPAQHADNSVISHSVEGASEATGIPKSTLWLYIKEGKLESYKVGRRRLIPHAALLRLVQGGGA